MSIRRRLGHQRGWGYPDVFIFYGSVLPSVIPIITITTLWTIIICYLYIERDYYVVVPIDLVGSVAVVVGLLLAFRTNNAYDRYYEGRKLFSNLCTQVRNCARTLWVGVVETSEEDHNDKEQTIKLLLAYVVAVKHHLRLEFGIRWPDLEDLLPRGFQLSYFDGNASQQQVDVGAGGAEDPNLPKPTDENNRTDLPSVSETVHGLTEIIPQTFQLLSSHSNGGSATIYVNDEEYDGEVDASMSLPLEIVMHLGLYFDQKFREGKMDGGRFGTLSAFLNALIENLGNLERISTTPMPRAEIENPFGYDKNDLPLDEYCKDLEAEVKYLQRHIPQRKAPTAT
ncbi:3772_t:CDS:2 [Ambispora gerdemannii]|uniref:3772_t:CDS:1 n=1 Tax=Ambispora gerdemannii TaxID=144530 RepID=A0A9N8VMU2_9GLOM|nr:3772_t:CDS:2 [Ambispora gerdemannii]